jgi:V8-like Glu-specific endopeptidase
MRGAMVTRFRPLVSIILIALSAPACSGPTNTAFSAFEDPADAPAPIRDAAQAVVSIDTASGSATGVFLSKDGMLLTNNHVLGVEVCPREGCYAKFTFSHERKSPSTPPVDVFVEPLHVDIGLDMAVLQAYSVDSSGRRGKKLVSPQSIELKPRDAGSLMGTHVHVIGHPKGRLKKWTSGEVVGSDGLWFSATAASLPGNSGSPVLDDAGHIVGLLHRGPTGADLITQSGANLYSIATASAAIEAALGEELPATVQSLYSDMTADDVAEQQELYLQAHVANASVDGVQKPVLTILGDACDQGLRRDDYTSPDDFYEGVRACSAAMRWILCDAAPTTRNWGVCPDETTRDLWRARFLLLFERQRGLNGELWLDAVSFAEGSLQTSEKQGFDAGRASLTRALADARPPLDLPLAPYLAAFDIDTYDGNATVDFLRAYADVPHYELWVPEIVYTALWLRSRDRLEPSEVESILARLEGDEHVSLGGKLLIEEVQYNLGFIE